MITCDTTLITLITLTFIFILMITLTFIFIVMITLRYVVDKRRLERDPQSDFCVECNPGETGELVTFRAPQGLFRVIRSPQTLSTPQHHTYKL